MYTFDTPNDSMKVMYIKEKLPSVEEHKKLAEEFAKGEYTHLGFGPPNGLTSGTPKCSVEFLQYYKGIKGFGINGYNVVDLHLISQFYPDLESLGLTGETIKDLSFLSKFKNLKALGVHGPVKNINTISEMQSLTSLSLSKLDMTTIGFHGLKNLSFLTLGHNCKGMEKSGIETLDSLLGIWFSFITNAGNFSYLSSLTNLIGISFFWVSKLESLPDLSNLTQLKTIEFDVCNRLTDIRGLMTNTSLENFRASGTGLDASALNMLNTHPSLKKASIIFDSVRKKNEAKQILGDKYYLPIDLNLYEINPEKTPKVRIINRGKKI
jgi:hypothetical protein